jgi:hypothetical protein
VLGSTKGRILSYFTIKTDDEQNNPWSTLGQPLVNPWSTLGQPLGKYGPILGSGQAGSPHQSHINTNRYQVIDHLSDVSG